MQVETEGRRASLQAGHRRAVHSGSNKEQTVQEGGKWVQDRVTADRSLHSFSPTSYPI